MTTIKKLLVAAEDNAQLAVALGKGADLARACGAALNVAEVIYDPVVEESIHDFDVEDTESLISRLMDRESEALEQLIAPFRASLAHVESRVVWGKNKATAIIAEADRTGAELLVKPLSPHRLIERLFHAPIDWMLMREAPCPVLFTSAGDWPRPGHVLAAVDVTDPGHEALNLAILGQARAVADALGGELHVVTAYPMLGQEMIQYQNNPDPRALKSALEAQRRDLLTKLLQTHGISVTSIHVVEGRPRIVINELANRLNSAVTVLGTAARSGVRKLVIGNTAEDIIRDLATDVLTVRAASAGKSS